MKRGDAQGHILEETTGGGHDTNTSSYLESSPKIKCRPNESPNLCRKNLFRPPGEPDCPQFLIKTVFWLAPLGASPAAPAKPKIASGKMRYFQ